MWYAVKKQSFLALFLSLCLWAGAEERPRVALVLGGGGAKGYAHIPVLELIEELGIPIDMIAGVSAGAIVGGLYCAGYSPAMIKDALTGLDWSFFFQDRPVSPFEEELGRGDMPFALRLDGGPAPDWGRGYSSGEKAWLFFKTLTVKLPSYINFDELPVPFRALAAEVPGGGVELLRQGDLAEAIRASMGVPGVFAPFEIDGRAFVDGGMLNNLPIREMGFDIVIGVELFPRPQAMDTSPAKVLNLMTDLYSGLMSRDQHSQADLILMPEVSRFTPMDFDKGAEIYTLAPEERERLKAALLPIREKTGAASRPPAGYGERPPAIIEKLAIQGLPGGVGGPESGPSPAVRARIERDFNRLIRGKALEEEALASFVNGVYESGSYRLVTARTDARGEETSLELRLYPAGTSKTLLLAGGNYAGVFSTQSLSKISLRSALEFQGLTGEGSVLRLESSIMDELSLGLFWFKPLGAMAFTAAKAEIVREQDVVVLGFLNDQGKVDQDLSGRASVSWGLRFNRRNLLSLSPEFIWVKSDAGPDRALGLTLVYTYSSLNYDFFPSRGFYAGIGNTLSLPKDPLWRGDDLSGIVTADLRAALPLGGRFSLAAGLFAGARLDFEEGAFPPDIPFLNFTAASRLLFPHVTSEGGYGAHKAAASLTLQFEPRKNLTLFGGQMLFLLSASAGEVMDGWDKFRTEELLWCASLGAGLRLNKRFGFCLRAGAGRDPAGGRAVPFISFDAGALR